MTVSLNEAAQLNPDSQCAGGDKTALPLLGTNYNYNRRRAFLPCLKARGLQPEDFDEFKLARGVSDDDGVAVEVPPGGVVWFHSHLLHKSTDNHSLRFRRSYQIFRYKTSPFKAGM